MKRNEIQSRTRGGKRAACELLTRGQPTAPSYCGLLNGPHSGPQTIIILTAVPSPFTRTARGTQLELIHINKKKIRNKLI